MATPSLSEAQRKALDHKLVINSKDNPETVGRINNALRLSEIVLVGHLLESGPAAVRTLVGRDTFEQLTAHLEQSGVPWGTDIEGWRPH